MLVGADRAAGPERVTVGNETKDAEVNVEGAELVETTSGTLQVLDEGDPAGLPRSS